MAPRQTSNLNAKAFVGEFRQSGWVFGLSDGRIALGWGELIWSKEPKPEGPSIYAPDFYLQSTSPWASSPDWAILSREDFQSLIFTGETPTTLLTWREPGREEFARVFEFLQNAFAKGTAQKAVPVVFAEAESSRSVDLSWLLSSALQRAPAHLRVYGVWDKAGGMLGFTPEILFEQSAGLIRTMALAGTRRGNLSASEEQAFLEDQKERREHQFVIDDLRETLSSWGKPQVSDTRVLRLPSLAHLYTPIEVVTSPRTFSDLVRALHPTPALGVAPRSLGLKWMSTWDPYVQKRERFGAPFGFSAQGMNDECVVAIRNVQWHDQGQMRTWKLGSGCGLVRESQLQNEWDELKAKRDSVRSLFKI